MVLLLFRLTIKLPHEFHCCSNSDQPQQVNNCPNKGVHWSVKVFLKAAPVCPPSLLQRLFLSPQSRTKSFGAARKMVNQNSFWFMQELRNQEIQNNGIRMYPRAGTNQA